MSSVIASVLVGVISQVLPPSTDGKSRVLVARSDGQFCQYWLTIRQQKLQQLPNEIAQGISQGQTIMNKELVRLFLNKRFPRI